MCILSSGFGKHVSSNRFFRAGAIAWLRTASLAHLRVFSPLRPLRLAAVVTVVAALAALAAADAVVAAIAAIAAIASSHMTSSPSPSLLPISFAEEMEGGADAAC